MRRAIYTGIFGGYDTLKKAPLLGFDFYDFIVFGDEIEVAPPWRRGNVGAQVGDSSRLANRRIKAVPPTCLGGSSISCYIDGNIEISPAITSLFDEFIESGADIGLYRHPNRKTVREEAFACVQQGKAEKRAVEIQIEHYEAIGFMDNELFDGSVIFRIQGSSRLELFGNLWLDEIERWNTRDQISLPVALRKSGVEVHIFEGTPRKLPRIFRYYRHHGDAINVLQEIKAFTVRNLLAFW